MEERSADAFVHERATGRSPAHKRDVVACVAAVVVVAGAAALVVALRIANAGPEPEGQNWWLVTWLVVGLAALITGTGLASRAASRALGLAFVVVGLAATLSAVSIQLAGFQATNGQRDGWAWLADASRWTGPLAMAVLAGVVPWLVPPGALDERVRRAMVVVVVASGGALVLAVSSERGPGWLASVSRWLLAIVASAAVARLALSWWRSRLGPDRGDPLPAWLLGGAAAAWLATVPAGFDVPESEGWVHDVAGALALLATVPLLMGGAVVAAMRVRGSPILGISHRLLEWSVLASGIVGVYTVLVAGLGRLVGGNGPTWLLVGATGALALVLEPFRRHVRRLVDRLVYGARDDPLVVVQRIVEHLGASTSETLLPTIVASLQHELRLDTVAIELRIDDRWVPAATIGPPSRHARHVPLRHRDELVGRLVVGWDAGPSLRHRDMDILAQLAGPLGLAVGWVRLADDLRRSSVAIVSAREEERRRLRRDLHDGVGPSLTGVSLGLRTAIQLLTGAPCHDATTAHGRTSGPGGDPDGPALTLLARVADEVDSLVVELKRIVRDLRPTALDQLGLAGAVAEFTRTFGDSVEIHLTLPPAPVELPAAVEAATYRIVTEAVTNVVRHANAARCWLTIAAGAAVVIDVVDDGDGIAPGHPAGVGLAAMHERARELGGTVELSTNDPHGTRVHVALPASVP